ncbi:aroma-sacti cluster domain-containing protein [Streptomyces sp. NBC_01465]|uniref:aroma-sacti cluster domain-containing protein n=1 Tax=Streptomyces sp. NBC_01465 TaxID=2903878 RepID=UPI002E316849|nr:aroma-sacti cluster domain-containing protein [Streptomyces sp. NBC_01465]
MDVPEHELPSPDGEFDPLAALRAGGFPDEGLDVEDVVSLAQLTPEEVTILLGLKSRLTDITSEVEAHSVEPIIGGVLF